MEALEKRIDDSISFIEQASKALENNQAVNLEDFHQSVREICEAMINMSQDEAQAYIEKMDKLQESLQAFEVDLRQRKADIEVEIKKLNKKQAAATAYENAKKTESE